jgi:hypothetical protein
VMETQRFGVTTTIFVDAADAGEAALIIERDFAGRFDSELASVTSHAGPATGARCPASGSRSASSTTKTSCLVATSGDSALMEPSCL